MKIKEILNALEIFAPLPLQDGFDNAGLQVGLTDVEATGALLCLDVTEEVVNEAIEKGYNLILSHHPLIFKGYKSITGRDYVERCIIKAIKYDVVIYSMHTNLDNALQGVNSKIAEKIGLDHLQILSPREESLLKLVTFVPHCQAENIRRALFDAGCGNIGDYDSCSYNLQGEGTFRAGKSTHPYCGVQGKLHVENETRIETILPAYKRQVVEHVLCEVHPYEEPAYDFYPLQNIWYQAGTGMIGELPVEEEELFFLQRIKELFAVECIRHSSLCGRKIRRVAVCGGSGAFLLSRAEDCGADVFITGDVKYHDYFGYEKRMLIADIGHYESEQYTKEIFYSFIKERFPVLTVESTGINTNPIKYLY